METHNTNKDATSSKKRRNVVIGLGVLATTILTYFGIQYWKKNKRKKSSSDDAPDFSKENYSTNQKSSTTKNTQTKKEQTKSDTTQSRSKSNDVHQKKGEKAKRKVPPVLIAKGLQLAYLKLDFLKAYTYLKLIPDVAGYVEVSKFFRLSLVGRGKKTLVTGLLEAFKTDTQRQLLSNEFKRIGLKQKGNQWTLGDLDGAMNLLITTRPAMVWKNPKNSVAVPINMVLGREICKRGEFTLFENQRQYYLVESSSVKQHT